MFNDLVNVVDIGGSLEASSHYLHTVQDLLYPTRPCKYFNFIYQKSKSIGSQELNLFRNKAIFRQIAWIRFDLFCTSVSEFLEW